MKKEEIIETLGLIPHIEGGHFKETYRNNDQMDTDRDGGKRNVMTSIYYMLSSDRPINHFHQNKSDIIHYFHAGSAITYIMVDLKGNLSRVKLGNDLLNGEVPQLLVPRGYWKAAELTSGEYGLIGESVAPGFDFKDMIIGGEDLKDKFPDLWEQMSPYIKR